MSESTYVPDGDAPSARGPIHPELVTVPVPQGWRVRIRLSTGTLYLDETDARALLNFLSGAFPERRVQERRK